VCSAGDFGESLWTKRPVITEMIKKIPVTFELGLLAIMFAMVISIPVGILSAIRQDTIGDYLGRSFAIYRTCCTWFLDSYNGNGLPIGMVGMVAIHNVHTLLSKPAWKPGAVHDSGIYYGISMSASTMRILRTTMLEVLRQTM